MTFFCSEDEEICTPSSLSLGGFLEEETVREEMFPGKVPSITGVFLPRVLNTISPC